MDEVVANAFEAGKKGEPWAIKYVMEFFIPKPSPFVPTRKTERNQVNVQINNLLHNLGHEDQQNLLALLLKGDKGIPAFALTETESKTDIRDAEILPNSEDK